MLSQDVFSGFTKFGVVQCSHERPGQAGLANCLCYSTVSCPLRDGAFPCLLPPSIAAPRALGLEWADGAEQHRGARVPKVPRGPLLRGLVQVVQELLVKELGVNLPTRKELKSRMPHRCA